MVLPVSENLHMFFFVHYRHNLISSTSSDGGFNKITAHGENALLNDNFICFLNKDEKNLSGKGEAQLLKTVRRTFRNIT